MNIIRRYKSKTPKLFNVIAKVGAALGIVGGVILAVPAGIFAAPIITVGWVLSGIGTASLGIGKLVVTPEAMEDYKLEQSKKGLEK